MTIPVSLQLAGDEIFAPTNPTVHCGRGGGASRVDISTRLRSGVGGLEAEEKTEGRTRRRAAQAEKEKEKEAKPRALTGKEIVDLAMQARLNWRDLKRLAALVERSKKSEGEEVKEKKSGVEDSRGRADGSEDHAADQRLFNYGRKDDAHGQHHVPVFKNQIVYRLIIINCNLSGQKMLERLHGPCARVVKREA